MVNSQIIPIWQPIGFSTHQISRNIGGLLNTKATHTGTLDPLAEGVIVVLTGDERFKKDKYSDYIKGYEFGITFGISTDSYDAMGFVTGGLRNIGSLNKEIDRAEIKSVCKKLVGKYTQTVPLYSAIRHGGKRLFEWAHLNIDTPDLPEKKGEIYKLELKKLNKVLFKKIIEEQILPNLYSIVGHFRQEKIIGQWEKAVAGIDPNVVAALGTFYAETSRGIYVRSLSQDICRDLNAEGFVTSLRRVMNGPYTKKDCKSLGKLFGGSFDKKEFVSKRFRVKV
ncbi:hypothetical protein JXA34_02210 [Patescibacteria group bacterium]|nr:hypothetical protein [Patescibacteria group bacterium]